MVTVIANKDELNTPGHNGVHVGSNDNERTFIKDYQEVDFHRSISCKPLPENIFAIIDNKLEQSSIQGMYFLQIDTFNQLNNDESSLLLTLTDGILTVKGITIESIPDLSLNIRPGCKLLLTGVIPIKNGLLQLSSENTRFQYGSNTYPRPKSAHRGRGGGSYRISNEGRRANGNSNNRYDNSTSETNFLKGPPPKTTLMDFMTSLKLTDDLKSNSDNHENSKTKDRYRRNTEPNRVSHENASTIDDTNVISQTTTDSNEQMTFQQDEINDQLDSEDDPTHSNYRERRNPLPPRLQRAQEERTRRNTVRYYDEIGYLSTNESNEPYHNDVTTTNQSLSSSSSYSRRGDQTSYAPNNSSTMNPYANILTTVNGSLQPHLAYFSSNAGPLVYNLAGVPSSPFVTPSSYPTDPVAFCYGAPYATSYLPMSMSNTYNSESKVNVNREFSSNVQSNSSVDDNENKSINESQQDENQSQISSSSSVNETNVNSEQNENNRQQRDSNPNPRPRWKIGDFCLARWSEDREFYPATIVQIHPPSCTVIFRDYNNYDQVHFSDLKILPRDQPYYPYVSPVVAATPDFNNSTASAYYPQRLAYYPSPVDGCIIMPEAPPFPFNSSGTLCMYVPRSNRYSTYSQMTHRQENGLVNHQINEMTSNSTSTMSKYSNDTSISNSSTVSNDNQQQESMEPYSITDAPLTLVMHDDQQEQNSQTNEDPLTNKKSSE